MPRGSADNTGEIAVDTRRLLTSSILSRAIGTIVWLFAARVLGPADFGILQLVNFVPSLTKFGSLGFDGVAQREIPHIRGAQGGLDKEQLVKNTAFTADLIWSLGLALLVIIAAFFAGRIEVRHCLWIAALSLLAGQVNRLYDTVSAVDKKFGLMAQVFLVSAAVEALVILPTVSWGRMYSVVVGTLLGILAGTGWYHRSIRLGFALKIDRRELTRLFKIALPLAGGTLAFGAFAWIERLGVLTLFRNDLLGIYMLSVMVFELGSLLLNSVLRASSVRLFEELGRDRDSRATADVIIAPTLLLAYVFPLLGGVVWLLGPPIVSLLLPAYQNVARLLPWIGVMLTARGIAAMPMTAMNSARLNMQTHFMFLWVGASAVFAGTTLAAAQLDLGIEGVAAGKCLTFFVMMIATYALTFRFFFRSPAQALAFIASTLMPLVVAAAVLLGITIMFPGGEATASVVKTLCFALIYTPVLIHLERQTKFLALFFGRGRQSNAENP